MGMDSTIRLRRESKYTYLSENVKSAITDIKCALTQKALYAFCSKDHISDEVHPVLPNQNDTMHERLAGKIGLYTRFFDYANFRLPLSIFLVDVLRHFHINISQLSVIGAAKNDHFFWVDDFACPASFPWHTAKNVIRDPAPVAADFNAQYYATLVAHPSPFWKFPEAFLCLVGLSRYYPLDEETYPRFLHKNREDMDIFTFIHTSDPTKVKIVERERNEDESLLLQTGVDRMVPLLLVAPDRAGSELEASVDRLFDDGGSGNQTEQGGSTGIGGDANIQLVSEAADIVAKDVAPLQPRRQRKTVGEAIPTLSFITSSVSGTLEREGGDHTDFMVLHSPDEDCHYYYRNGRSYFSADSSSAGRVDPNTGVFSNLSSSDFLVDGIRTVIDPDTDLQKVYVPQWSVTNGSGLDDGHVCREMVDEFAPPKFFASVCGMKHDQLFTEFNVGAARQMYLSAEVRMRVEYNVKERRRLKYVVEKQDELLKVNALKERNTILEKDQTALDVKVTDLEASVVSKERELTGLNAQLTFVKSKNDNLMNRVHELELSSSGLQEKVTVYEDFIGQLEKFQDDQMKEVNDKFDKLYAHFIKIALHLEERFYPHLLTTISGRR
ncbi:hypothetical protein Tco_0470921 [Tanacetum coccineum]